MPPSAPLTAEQEQLFRNLCEVARERFAERYNVHREAGASTSQAARLAQSEAHSLLTSLINANEKLGQLPPAFWRRV